MSAGKEGMMDHAVATTSSQLHVPPDLIREILWKLPVKSLLRFKAVCKSWRELILSPQFRAKHRRIMLSSDTSRHSNGKVPVLVNYSRSASIVLNPYFLFQPRNIQLPHELQKEFISFAPDFLGPCNGVYLVIGVDKTALWNYATREYKILSLSNNVGFLSFSYFGFGSEELEDGRVDFLILRTDMQSSRTELYRLSTGEWKYVKQAPISIVFGRFRNDAVMINGAFYWLESENGIYYLNSLDTKRDTLTKECLPDDIEQYCYPTVSCCTIGGAKLLSLTQSSSSGIMNIWVQRECDGRRFWSMKEIIKHDLDANLIVKTSANYKRDQHDYKLVYQVEESLVSFY